MPPKEVVIVIVNGIVGLALVVAVWFGKMSAPNAVAIAVALVTPSAAPTLTRKLVELFKSDDPAPPSPGASVLLLIAAGVLAIATSSCGFFGGTDPTLPPECEGYAVGLQACTATSRTLKESIACENVWRMKCRRPLRTMLAADAGARPPMKADVADGGAS